LVLDSVAFAVLAAVAEEAEVAVIGDVAQEAVAHEESQVHPHLPPEQGPLEAFEHIPLACVSCSHVFHHGLPNGSIASNTFDHLVASEPKLSKDHSRSPRSHA
jgi:hypothetical protein